MRTNPQKYAQGAVKKLLYKSIKLIKLALLQKSGKKLQATFIKPKNKQKYKGFFHNMDVLETLGLSDL